MQSQIVTPDEVKKIAKLANLTLRDNEVELFADQFTSIVGVVNELNQIDTTDLKTTSRVNGLSNITRADEIDKSRILPQNIALREAKNTHNGFFVVKRLIDSDANELV